MKKIDYRFYSKDAGKFLAVEEICLDRDFFVVRFAGTRHHIDGIHKLERYTGMIDFNGKLAYFGDKIKLMGDDDYSKYDGWYLSDEDPKYILLVAPDRSDAIPFFQLEYCAHFLVIGTIHEV